MRKHGLAFIAIIYIFIITSCQKEAGNNNSSNGNEVKTPKVGTKWIYRYSTYYQNGGLIASKNVVYIAVNEESHNGITWLNIVDSATSSTVFLLSKKTDGLYLFTTNPWLLCKNPANINDTYHTFNGTDTTDFTVKSINDTLQLGVLVNVTTDYYEGSLNNQTIDEIWFNTEVWIAQRYYYKKLALTPYYRYASLILQDITY